jgi:hypothetical protein
MERTNEEISELRVSGRTVSMVSTTFNNVDAIEQCVKILTSTTIPNHPFIAVTFPLNYPNERPIFHGLPKSMSLSCVVDDGTVVDVAKEYHLSLHVKDILDALENRITKK